MFKKGVGKHQIKRVVFKGKLIDGSDPKRKIWCSAGFSDLNPRSTEIDTGNVTIRSDRFRQPD